MEHYQLWWKKRLSLVFKNKYDVTETQENERFWSKQMALPLTEMLGHVTRL